MHWGVTLVEPNKKISEITEANQFSTDHPLIKNALRNIEDLSFEETHKTAYSHGLESIYALENVDIKSVRRLSSEEKPASKQQPIVIIEEDEDAQLRLDLGEEWRGKIDSFVPQEPIQVLGLAKPAEKCLIEQGKTRLKDLIDVDLRSFIFFKGMGQGHIEEIKQKLAQYLNGRSVQKCSTIDFYAWIRSLIATFERKKIYVLFDAYELSEMVTLNAAEVMEVRRLTLEKRREWIQEATTMLTADEIKSSVVRDMQSIVSILIKPWVRERGGFATAAELEERLEQISPGQLIAEKTLHLFSDLYFDGEFPLQCQLVAIDDKLFCVDSNTQSCYEEIVRRAAGYFYKPDVRYPLDQLVAFLEREMALEWRGYHEGTVKKALRLSTQFRVWKGMNHQLMIVLA